MSPSPPHEQPQGAASGYDSSDFLPQSLNEEFTGRLIVLEGPDGSGRSSHIKLLGEWLEWQGFAVQTMGLKRSKLLGDDLNDLGRNNELHHRTRVLLYATDFYDQIERSIEAFSSGGLFGRGPGEGQVKQVLPDAHADFVFAVAGEELGLFVALFIVTLFAFIVHSMTKS